MRKLAIVAALASTAFATPAVARDRSAYVGLEVGPMLVEDLDLDVDGDVVLVSDGISIDHKYGWDADVLAGYDLGRFRIEGELGWKRASVDEVTVVNDAVGTFDAGGRTRIFSAMLNGLVDIGDDDDRWSGYLGGGVGYARVAVRAGADDVNGAADFVINAEDSAFAWQGIAGLRYAVSPNVDLGLKYRYFNTGKLNFGDSDALVCGPFTQIACEETGITTRGKFRSHSLMLSLIYNFYTPPPPPPPVEVAPPPPPPPPPATQTCPDGTVILATEMCPAPPPPPPPPPPAPERG